MILMESGHFLLQVMILLALNEQDVHIKGIFSFSGIQSSQNAQQINIDALKFDEFIMCKYDAFDWIGMINEIDNIEQDVMTLPFRGHREDFASENRGNFLELVSLLSNSDPVLKEHSIRLQQSLESGLITVSYLSPAVQNEFISLLGDAVKQESICEIKKAKFYGILFDSTPDKSHTEQMSQVIRYVKIDNRNVEVKESFLGFIPLSGKKTDSITQEIVQSLEKDGLDLKLCQSQGYDNATTMSGIHTGVQTRIKEFNPKAIFVPCANHSLNLCGAHAFGSVSVNHAQKYLQIEGISLEKCVVKLKSLKTFLVESREVLAHNAVEYATQTCAEMSIDIESRKRKRVKKMMRGEIAKDAGLTLLEELKRAMFECIDHFHVELEKCLTSMNTVYEKFAVVHTGNLLKATDEEIVTYAHQFSETFNDVEEEEILPEVKRLRRHLKASVIKLDIAAAWTSLKMAQFIIEMDFRESLPNVTEALKLFLTICVSVASCEKSFSKLKLIKNLRSAMSQSRLTSLAIISVENEIAKHVNFDELIKQFAEVKARKKAF
nr:uncharacterized protein LOC124817292 [Hydra vulgaris]